MKLDEDDRPRGSVLTRREVLLALGATGVALLARCSGSGKVEANAPTTRPGCVVRPEQTEGPYFVDERLDRADVRSDPTDGTVKPGTPLALEFHVSRVAESACVPLAGAVIDIWHCDHQGIYSDVVDPTFDMRGKKFLRGFQVTDADGVARFTTIYPGWYQGRAVHIHFKIRSAPSQSPGFDFTSQLYFDDELTDQVHARAPYAEKGSGRTRNDQDGIYRRGGSQLLLSPTPQGDGYAATFEVALESV